MSDSPEPAVDLLAFPPPSTDATGDWIVAEREALKFPNRFVKKAKEAKETRDQLQEAWAESNKLHEQLYGFTVRNLIAIADNCKSIVSAPPADGAEPLPESLALASVYRSVLYLLESFGAVPIPLLGRTYTNVEIDGKVIDDPFDVVESEQKGRTDEITVREVIYDLWILRRNGHIEILRRGKVNC